MVESARCKFKEQSSRSWKPRKLNDEWEPTIKIKIKDHECYALCDLGASVSTHR